MRTVVGIHAAKEVLKVRPKSVREIILKEGLEKDQQYQEFIEASQKFKIKLTKRPEGFLSKIAASHQGIALTVDSAPTLDLESISPEEGEDGEKIILLALDEVTDPHNIGAVLRTGWLMGVKGIIVPTHRAGHLTPASMKVASGGAEHVPLIVVNNLSITLRDLKDKGFWIYGLAGDAKQPLYKTQFPSRVVIVTGAEDKGLRSTTKTACDDIVSIPQTNFAASYNASVATAIVTYEVFRQHQATKC